MQEVNHAVTTVASVSSTVSSTGTWTHGRVLAQACLQVVVGSLYTPNAIEAGNRNGNKVKQRRGGEQSIPRCARP